MRLLIEGANDFAQVIHIAVRGLCSGSRFKRGRIATAHHAGKYADLEERDELLLGVNLTAGGRRRLHPPGGTQHAVAVEREKTREETWSRCFWGCLQGEHLNVALAHLQMIAVPGNGTVDDLTIYSGISAKLILLRPFLKVEEIAEKLESLRLAKKPETK